MKKRRAGLIYVIQEADSPTAAVKVGFANDVVKRLFQLQAGNSRQLRIVKMFHGDSKLEAALHRSFKRYRLVGEWFEYSDEVKETLSIFKDTSCVDEPKEPTIDEEIENWLSPEWRNAQKLIDAIGRPPGYKGKVRPPDRIVMHMVMRGIL